MTRRTVTALALSDLVDENGQPVTPYERMGYLVRDSHREFRRILHMLIAEHGLSASRWSYMWALWQQDGLTQKDLADRVKLEGPTVGAAVQVLARRGFIVRQRNPADLREWRIYLTPKSKRLKSVLLAVVERINQEALAEFEESEAYELARYLLRLRRGLRAMRARLEKPDKSATTRKRASARAERVGRAGGRRRKAGSADGKAKR